VRRAPGARSNAAPAASKVRGHWGPSAAAEPSGAAMSNRIRQLEEMGFTQEVARRVLAECVWDVNKAIDRLLQSGVPSEEKAPALPTEVWQGKHCESTPASGSTTASATSTPRSLGHSTAASPTAAQRPADGEDIMAASEVLESDARVDSPECLRVTQHPRNALGSDGSETREACAAEENVAEARHAEPVASAPRQQIERVETPWQAEDETQMTVARGDFVRVWAEHGSLNGWVYAEALDGAAAGWLPAFSLQALPKHQRWLRALRSCGATHSAQRDVEEGRVLLVNVESRTDIGWVYAEAPEGDDTARGWVPMSCLEHIWD